MPSAPDLVLTEIDDGFAFNQSDDPLYLGFLKERGGKWKLTELDDGGVTTGTCEERDEMLEDVTEIIAPKILQNALELQGRVTEAEDRMAAMQSRLDGAGLALCKELPQQQKQIANNKNKSPTTEQIANNNNNNKKSPITKVANNITQTIPPSTLLYKIAASSPAVSISVRPITPWRWP